MAGWFSGTLQDPDEAMNEYMLWGQPDSPARSAMELVRGLDETWAFILARLQRWTPDDLTLMTRCVIFSYDALRYKRVFTRLLNLQVNCSSYADKA